MAHSKLRRTSGPRKAVLRSLVTALFQNGRIQTTEAKAKELRKTADKMISLAKRGDLTKKLFNEIAKKYTDRNGGYTRIIKLGLRQGDAAPVAIIELV